MNTTSQVFSILFYYFNIIWICNINYYNSIFSIWCTLSANYSNFTIRWNFNIVDSSCINLNTINLFNIWWVSYIPKIGSSISSPGTSYCIISFIYTLKDPKIWCMFIVYRSWSNFFYFSLNFSLKYINNLWFWYISKWSSQNIFSRDISNKSTILKY